MEIILVSACLLGENTKYDGKNNYNPLIEKVKENYDIIPICPEVMGGLKTPRVPSEVRRNSVYTKNGKNVTNEFYSGASTTLQIAKYNRVTKAILKENSPSCGVHKIYNGLFNGLLINEAGITTRKLLANNIECYTLEEFVEKFLSENRDEKEENN